MTQTTNYWKRGIEAASTAPPQSPPDIFGTSATAYLGQIRELPPPKPEPGEITDPVVALYLRHLRKQRAKVKEVQVSLNGPYMIYTEVESKSPDALNKVYRAEAATQAAVARQTNSQAASAQTAASGQLSAPIIVFQHRNRALEGQQVLDEFLERGHFLLLRVE